MTALFPKEEPRASAGAEAELPATAVPLGRSLRSRKLFRMVCWCVEGSTASTGLVCGASCSMVINSDSSAR